MDYKGGRLRAEVLELVVSWEAVASCLCRTRVRYNWWGVLFTFTLAFQDHQTKDWLTLITAVENS